MADALTSLVRLASTEEAVRSLLSAPHVLQEIDKPGPSGVNALALAVWRNHAGLVGALLEAGADPDARDAESGWSPLHRALHWGQLRAAAALLAANASLGLPDWRGRTPLDLLSAELKEFLAPQEGEGEGLRDGDLWAWGNGSNYTLGTGSTDWQEHPARLESLHDQQVVAVAAAKFHSAALTADGRVLTWGWGRGGRLGHPDAHVHSGEGAVIQPAAVAGLGRRAVAAVAAAKHHTLLCTTAGEVWTFGSNRHGQLGYAVDSQPTPRRVTSLRARVVAVAAANKHSVAVAAGGEVYTWGSNALGQLGYGTSDSSSSAAPRLVEAMRGKPVVAAAAAKRHTLVLTAAGEAYTWGHRGVSPRRVQLAGARDAAGLDGAPLRFHRGHADVARPVAAAICAGAAHSAALTASGVVLCWRSADPALQVQEVGGALAGKRVVSIAAGKYRLAAVSDEGDVFMWEGRSDYFPQGGREAGSGSKKPGAGAGSATKARPIPGSGGRLSLGGAGAESGGLAGFGSWGSPGDHPAGGSPHGSHTRRPGSFIERFAREREAAGGGAGSYGAGGAGSFGAGGGASALTPGRAARLGDTFERIRPQRVEGLKRAAAVAVGEKHSLALQRWSAAQLEGMAAVPWLAPPAQAAAVGSSAAAAEEDSWYQAAADGLAGEPSGLLATPRGMEGEGGGDGGAPAASPSPGRPSPVRPGPRRARPSGASVGVPSLQRICEEEVARRLVDPRTCLQVLEYADVAGAELLRAYCLAVAACNLDAVLLEAGGAFEALAPHLLAELERIYKLRLSGAKAGPPGQPGAGAVAGAAGASAAAGGRQAEAAEAGEAGPAGAAPPRPGSRLQPGLRPTTAAPWLGDAGLEEDEAALLAGTAPPLAALPGSNGGSSFLDRQAADAAAAALRLLRTLHKKLQQIESLEARAAAGTQLDAQQRAKVEARPVIQSAVAALGSGMAAEDVQAILRAAGGGREAEEEPAAGAAAGSCSKAAAASGGSSSSKAPKPKRSSSKVAEAGSSSAAAAEASAAAAAAVAAAAEASEALLGSSPPASNLVPAFGAAGSVAAAAEQPRTPAVEAEQPGTPGGGIRQVRSQVGFATAGDLAAAAGQQQQQQQQGPPSLARLSSGSRPKSAAKRKGGLSMFLRGELESSASPAEAAEASGGSAAGSGAPAAPAWGARTAAAQAGATSLKAILDQEAAATAQAPRQAAPQGPASKPPTPGGARLTPGSGVKARSALEPAAAAGGSSSGGASAAAPLRLSLASFMQSSPMAAAPRRDAAPAWGGATGASPPARAPASFRAIQQEQEALQPARPPLGSSPPAVQRVGSGLPWRVTPPAPGAAAAALLGTSPSGSGSLLGTSPSQRAFLPSPVPQQSKWYVPEEARADRKSLACIQSEEEALQEIARKFGDASVRPAPSSKPPTAPGLLRPDRRSSGAAGGGSQAAAPPPAQPPAAPPAPADDKPAPRQPRPKSGKGSPHQPKGGQQGGKDGAPPRAPRQKGGNKPVQQQQQQQQAGGSQQQADGSQPADRLPKQRRPQSSKPKQQQLQQQQRQQQQEGGAPSPPHQQQHQPGKTQQQPRNGPPPQRRRKPPAGGDAQADAQQRQQWRPQPQPQPQPMHPQPQPQPQAA